MARIGGLLQIARNAIGCVEHAQCVVVFVFARVLVAQRKLQLHVIGSVRITFMLNHALFPLQQLVDSERFAHGRGIAEQKLIEVGHALGSRQLPQRQVALNACCSRLQKHSGDAGGHAHKRQQNNE